MLHVVTLLWQANGGSLHFSRGYDETWVEKLYGGFKRNLTRPFRFVCFTDRERDLPGPIEQRQIEMSPVGYGACIEPYGLGAPMILVGLDTVITGTIDHLADYCLTADKVALPRDPFTPSKMCNGVALVPEGQQGVYERWNGENDMQWMRAQRTACIDDLFPGHVVSFKGHVKQHGLGDARIVYFHGREKPPELDLDWVVEHWRKA